MLQFPVLKLFFSFNEMFTVHASHARTGAGEIADKLHEVRGRQIWQSRPKNRWLLSTATFLHRKILHCHEKFSKNFEKGKGYLPFVSKESVLNFLQDGILYHPGYPSRHFRENNRTVLRKAVRTKKSWNAESSEKKYNWHLTVFEKKRKISMKIHENDKMATNHESPICAERSGQAAIYVQSAVTVKARDLRMIIPSSETVTDLPSPSADPETISSELIF